MSVEQDETPMHLYVDWFGDEQRLFSTEYPDPDSTFPHSIEKFLSLPLGESTKRKMPWENCARLYALE